jgi:hypothetical protein
MEVGKSSMAKVSGKIVPGVVKGTSGSRCGPAFRAGWVAANALTGCEFRIKSAQRLRGRLAVRPARHFDRLGEQLRSLIEEKCGPRQIAAVARRAGLAPAHLDQILTGRRLPRLETLSKLLFAIPAKPSELFRNQ